MELCCCIKLRIDIYTIRHRLAHHWGVWVVSLNLTTNEKRIVQNIDLNCRALIELFLIIPRALPVFDRLEKTEIIALFCVKLKHNGTTLIHPLT